MSETFTALGDRLIGTWTTESRHPLLPGETITGTSSFEWLDGDAFLMLRAHTDHAQIPDAVSLIEADRQHYFDSRGVRRVYDLTVTSEGWTVDMGKPDDGDFGQRIVYAFDGDQIDGLCQLSYEPGVWQDDLRITLRRSSEPRADGAG